MNRRRSKSPLDSINDTRDSRLRGSSLAPTLPVIVHDDKNLYGGCVDASLYFVRHCTSRNTVLYICTGGESYTFRSVYFRESARHLARYSAAGLRHFFLFFFLPLCFLIRILGAYHVIYTSASRLNLAVISIYINVTALFIMIIFANPFRTRFFLKKSFYSK